MFCQGHPNQINSPITSQGSFAFKSRTHEIFMETRPKVVVPIPLDMPGGCGNLNYSLYRAPLFTSSNIYLNCPIWQIPLQANMRIIANQYSDSRREYFDGAYRIIKDDMQDMNK